MLCTKEIWWDPEGVPRRVSVFMQAGWIHPMRRVLLGMALMWWHKIWHKNGVYAYTFKLVFLLIGCTMSVWFLVYSVEFVLTLYVMVNTVGTFRSGWTVSRWVVFAAVITECPIFTVSVIMMEHLTVLASNYLCVCCRRRSLPLKPLKRPLSVIMDFPRGTGNRIIQFLKDGLRFEIQQFTRII